MTLDPFPAAASSPPPAPPTTTMDGQDGTEEASRPTYAIEQTLEQLLQSLLEMGICASDVQESALSTTPGGVASGYPGGLMGRKASQTMEHLARLYSLRETVQDVMIPLEVINYVDQGKNPHLYTRDFIERVAGENMYTNGILSAVSDYREILTGSLNEAFPELAEQLAQSHPIGPGSDGDLSGNIKTENGVTPGGAGINGGGPVDGMEE